MTTPHDPPTPPESVPTTTHLSPPPPGPASPESDLADHVRIAFDKEDATPPDCRGYIIVGKINEGGQGIVYKAQQKSTGQDVAIKVFKSDSEITRELSKKEKELLVALKHPSFVRVVDAGITKNTPKRMFVVMEYIEGLNLEDHVRNEGLAIDDTLRLFATVCQGVGFAHEGGVIHRDLKPANILVDNHGNPKILDLGLAKHLLEHLGQKSTASGQVVGTPGYMSPEQMRGESQKVDKTTDVYALGVILCKLLTGRHPYPERQSGESNTVYIDRLLKQIEAAPPARPSRTWCATGGVSACRDGTCPIHRDLDIIVLKALSREKDGRYKNGDEMAGDIAARLGDDPLPSQRDQVAYRLRHGTQSFIARHPVVTMMMVAVVTLAFVDQIGGRLLYNWTPLNARYERLMTSVIPFSTGSPPFRDVRVIAVTDKTDIKAAAEHEGLVDVSQGDRLSHRPLHGRLMEKLAASGCRAVLWDGQFTKATPGFAKFLEGVGALNRAGVPLVAGAAKWWLGNSDTEDLKLTIESKIPYGGMLAGMGADDPWSLQLFAQRGASDPLPSLALRGYAAYRHPRTAPQFRLDKEIGAIYVLYTDKDNAGREVEPPDPIKLTYVTASGSEKNKAFGLEATDLYGDFFLPAIPSDEVLRSATIDYGDIFSKEPEQLRDWFDDKAVVIGYMTRDDKDIRKYDDGRFISGVYLHAVGLDSLIRESPIRLPDVWGELIGNLFGALLGVAIALLVARRSRTMRGLILLGVTAVLIAVSASAYWAWGLLFSPLLPAITVVLAYALSRIVARTTRSESIFG